MRLPPVLRAGAARSGFLEFFTMRVGLMLIFGYIEHVRARASAREPRILKTYHSGQRSTDKEDT